MSKTRAKQTAAEAYTQARGDIAILADCIEMELQKHRADAEADGPSWGQVGDLQHVRQQLKETLGFLMNWSDEDARNAAIEEHLAAMRQS